MNNVSLIINTVTKNKDLWPMFFGQIEKHIPQNFFHEKHIFVNDCNEAFPDDYKISYFESDAVYQEQFTSCIQNVTDEYCIYISEDYILYNDMRCDLVEKYVDILNKNKDLSFIRFMRGGIVNLHYPWTKRHDDLYVLYNSHPYFYTNQAAVWKTRDLELIHKEGPKLHISNADHENSFEYKATEICQQLNINGVYCYHNEPKRGMYHYDSIVFPHVSTALVKGKWNLSEYEQELAPLFNEYGIDQTGRENF
jgi:hypothetical protein